MGLNSRFSMHRWLRLLPVSVFAALLLDLAGTAVESQTRFPAAIPEFGNQSAQAWINSPPIRQASLRGQVVLLDVFAAGWTSCLRSFPWVHGLEAKYAKQGFRVISIHTPEVDSERKREVVIQIAKQYHIENPIYLDNDEAYFSALHNVSWPSFYVVDRQGRIRLNALGEMDAGAPDAAQAERAIQQALSES